MIHSSSIFTSTSSRQAMLQAWMGLLPGQKAPFALVNSGMPLHFDLCTSAKWADKTDMTNFLASAHLASPPTRRAK